MRGATAFALAAILVPRAGVSQDTGALPPGHPPVESAGDSTLPPGHPPIDATNANEANNGAAANPHGAGSTGMNVREIPLQEGVASEATELPAGIVLVRVVDALGLPVPNVRVHMGAMREGERQSGVDLLTRFDGVAQFEGLATGSNVSYRASLQSGSAHFFSSPFQLPSNDGYRVQIVRYDTTDRVPRSVLISNARVDLEFRDDRLVVTEHASIVNFSNMSLDGQPPQPVAFAAPGGLRFALPEGYSAFHSDERSMGDQHMSEERGAAILEGSIPPTGAASSIPVVFQYRMRLSDSEAALQVALPLPVLRAGVISQAPNGMQLEVVGMPPPVVRTSNGQRVFFTERQRTSREDPSLDVIEIRLHGIPKPAGAERWIAMVFAISFAFGSTIAALKRKFGGAQTDAITVAALKTRRDQLLTEASELARLRDAAEIGPETLARRKREVTLGLADVLQQLGAAKKSRAATRGSSA